MGWISLIHQAEKEAPGALRTLAVEAVSEEGSSHVLGMELIVPSVFLSGSTGLQWRYSSQNTLVSPDYIHLYLIYVTTIQIKK